MAEIVLDNLTRTFPRQSHPTIDHLSLTIQHGELLALLGPSGSGKSTILKMIAGIETPDSGDILLNGRSILPVPANRRGVALMFQKAYLFPFLTIADNIGFGLKVKKTPRKTLQARVKDMLDLIELPGFERRYPAQLSGGEQQRVALARSLIIEPAVLLLDEPLSSLDTAVRHTMQETIRRIQREMHITTMLVTHDLSEAIAMSDRTALLLNGRLAACDRPDCLFQRPPTRQAAQFVGISTFLQGTVTSNQLTTHMGPLEIEPDGATPRTATYAIRPEHIQLRDTPDANTLCGQVTSLLYKGEFTEYQVSLDDTIIRAKVYHATPQYAVGDKVYMQFPKEYLFEVPG
jgi:ABC-type Fe3+/spermidine/putrescine transport system ATPase subunit